jgi:hypothetical protein
MSISQSVRRNHAPTLRVAHRRQERCQNLSTMPTSNVTSDNVLDERRGRGGHETCPTAR